MTSSNPVAPAALDLLTRLVTIPSYVDATHNEVALADFVCDWVREYVPALTIAKQYIKEDSGRYNIVLRGKNSPKLFIMGHLDTVAPHEGWQTDPLKLTVKDGQAYGLGVADIKGAIAALLTALANLPVDSALDDLMILLYADEEYDFAGIQHFLTTSAMSELAPQLILSLCAELSIASGCRGDIEVSFTVTGQSGHAANPANGRNAITGAVDIFRAVEAKLLEFTDEHLGATTSNLSDLSAGSGQGNVIPGEAAVTFEVRPSLKSVTAQMVIKLIEAEAADRDLIIGNAKIRHDIAPWPTNFNTLEFDILKRLYSAAGIPFTPASRALLGYIDIQMITERIDASAYLIGLSGPNMHAPNENASLAELDQATRLYEHILKEFLG